MKNRIAALFALIGVCSPQLFAQEVLSDLEKYPVFDSCENLSQQALADCFYNTMQRFVYSNFKTPEIIATQNYQGEMVVLFEITAQGEFKVLYIDAAYQELKDETNRVFGELPTIEPATYNSRPTYVQFSMPLSIPLEQPVMQNTVVAVEQEGSVMATGDNPRIDRSDEIDAIQNLGYQNQEYTSQLNIPLSHQNYALFDPALNQIGANNHTAQKPFIYNQVNGYYNFQAANDKLLKNKSSWFGRKWWNEHMVTFKGEDYWFTLDPGVDLQLGRGDDVDTYNNTRLVYFQGGIGKKLNFFAAVYESQGRFAGYFNRYAESLAPDGGNPAIIPSRNIAEPFKTDSYDYPVAEGYISYAPRRAFQHSVRAW